MRDSQILAQCLVEGDLARVRRFRLLRRRALLFSIAVELMMLVALLLAPLASPETLTRRPDLTPIPPYGSRASAPNKPTSLHVHPVPPIDVHHGPIFQPTKIPQSTPPPDAGDELQPGSGWVGTTGGGPEGLIGLPSGENSNATIPAPKVPKPSEPRPRIIHVSQLGEASLVHKVMPVYPPLAVQTRTEGEVKLHAVIATDGTIQSLEVVSGHPLLIDAARDAVLQWRYRPATLNGRPVELDTFIIVIFRLEH